jgi:hypothetical protein
MGGLIYDEQSLVDSQIYKYDQFLHSRINKYTGNGRTIVTYYNINDDKTTTSIGTGEIYQVLGVDSPLRFNKIERFPLLGFSPLSPEDSNASQTQVRNYALNGEAYVIPGTVQPKENDLFIVNHLNMNHIFRVVQVNQDGLNIDGYYKISYSLHTTNPNEIEWADKQTVKEFITDLQTIGGEDLTPVIGKEDYDHRSRLIQMVNDMIENYTARFYDGTHNCYLLHLNGRTLFDLCGNMFMAKWGVMIDDRSNGNVVLNPNKIRRPDMDELYQRSPYKWIERDAPMRYLDTFKYRTVKGWEYPDSSFALYGTDVDIMIPGLPWCHSTECEYYFPIEVMNVIESEYDNRTCNECDCKCCSKRETCCRHHKLKRFDYVSLIHDFVHGKLTSIDKLSLYIGDQLFDNSLSQEVYLWTPMIIYIIKHVLQIK